jgi:DNA-binding response OmpR family regulator
MTAAKPPSSANVVRRPATPKVLLVDDERDLRELATDLLPRQLDCRLAVAKDCAEARRAIDAGDVDLLVVDLNLPDGDGMSLISRLRAKNPAACAMVITGHATVDNTVTAIRQGVIDYLPKPFTADQISRRLQSALEHQAKFARDTVRLTRLRTAVKKLNKARKTVSKKVDLLCNDLVNAYTEVARQVDEVRTNESFRKLLATAKDLEQLLCHAMDWLLRKLGYCNIAIYLTGDEGRYDLGAYMKYTVAGTKELTEALREGLVPAIVRDGACHYEPNELKGVVTPAELKHLKGQAVAGINCTYLGESLGVMVLFREHAKTPITGEDLEILSAIAPIFATSLASLVRRAEDGEAFDGPDGPDGPEDDGGDDRDEGNGGDDDLPRNDTPKPSKKAPRPSNPSNPEDAERQRKKKEMHDADWWKRGEPPPF